MARQIGQGAPADLFLSANQKWMDYLVSEKAVDAASNITLLKNTLVLIAPKNSPLQHVPLDPDWDIKASFDGSRMAVGDPDHVPAGVYAEQALKNLGLWQQAQPLLARANNVRAALALVERGESPLGIVYGTDANIAKDVKVVAIFPATSHKPIEYPLAVWLASIQMQLLRLFTFAGQSSEAVFEKYGFGVN